MSRTRSSTRTNTGPATTGAGTTRRVAFTALLAGLAVGFTALPLGDALGPMPAAGTEGGPIEPLSGKVAERWLHGRELFAREFTVSEGLGPISNDTSCGACHNLPVLGGAGGLEHNVGGDEALGEAIGYDLGGASRGSLNTAQRRTRLGMSFCETEPEPPRAVGIQTPSLLGLSLLESIPDHVILEREDPDDLDEDGVRGVANRVTVDLGYVELGRFGWRAQAPDLDDFVRGACGGELGLTVPWEGRGFGQMDDGDGVIDPELSRHEFVNLSLYCAELAAPPRGTAEDEALVARGEELFEQTGCAVCHVPELQGSRGPVALYSDLLTHRVVERRALTEEEKRMQTFLETTLARRAKLEAGRGAAAATGADMGAGAGMEADPEANDETDAPLRFRTPPLWGISRTAPYLHDGRAPTLAEAIEGHGLEGAGSRDRWRALDEEDRAALLAFLDVL